MVDDDGYTVKSGDWISFSYGIPPVGVRARLSNRDGTLWATVLGKHRPREIRLKDLRKYVGNWYKCDGSHYQGGPSTPPRDGVE